MDDLATTAPAFVEMAHRIVWCTVATVGPDERPRSRILHPLWEWDGERLTGWIATSPTRIKREHLEHTPYLTLTYWSPEHDTCTADCRAEWCFDDQTRIEVWDKFKGAPAPVGYDPAIIPVWPSPTDPAFAALRLEPWRLRVMPGEVMLSGGAKGRTLTWES